MQISLIFLLEFDQVVNLKTCSIIQFKSNTNPTMQNKVMQNLASKKSSDEA